MATRLLLVRHGQSEWNALGRWQGQADPPLSDLGRAQARAAVPALPAIGTVFSSPLARARETAEIIAEGLGLGRASVRVDEDLKERDAGEWSGLTRAEIEEAWPGYLDSPIDEHRGLGPTPRQEQRRPPGWEPDDDLLARARAAIGRVVAAAAGDGPVLVVTHGGLVYTVEVSLGASFARMANLEGRWVEAASALRLGDRVRLVDPDDVAVTVPGEL